MIVMKFGGSSLASAEALQRVASIVATRTHQKPVVVVSAMGKTTDILLDMAAHAVAGRRDEALQLLLEREQFHLKEGGHLEGQV